jgi:curved DNA-binding protein CbpA
MLWQAYEVLRDEESRREYDEGGDLPRAVLEDGAEGPPHLEAVERRYWCVVASSRWFVAPGVWLCV